MEKASGCETHPQHPKHCARHKVVGKNRANRDNLLDLASLHSVLAMPSIGGYSKRAKYECNLWQQLGAKAK